MANISLHDLQRVTDLARGTIEEHPEHKTAVIELARLALDEIDSGESADNELELMQDSINELILD